jgi:uncharacterized protein
LGEVEVEIPLSQLRSVIRTDPRAPSPSFSCKTAKTPVERAICSDALLARADRNVAEVYAMSLSDAYLKDEEREKLRQAQRDFLATRDQACGLQIDCLKKAYATRRKTMRR